MSARAFGLIFPLTLALGALLSHGIRAQPQSQNFTTTVTEINPDSSTLDPQNPLGASGGRVNGIATTSLGNTFYAASEWGGIWKSSDQGRTWTLLSGHVPKATWDVAVSPDNDQRVYATSFYDGRTNSLAGVNVSTDGGQTWTHPQQTAPTNFCLSQERRDEPSAFGISTNPDDPSEVYVGTNCGLLISEDRGNTWNRVDPTPNDGADTIWDVVVHDQGIIDVCGDDGHLRSTDGGQNWTTAPGAGLPGGQCNLAVSPDESYVLFAVQGTNTYESDDGGQTWQQPDSISNPSAQGRVPFFETNKRSGNNFDLWFGDVGLVKMSCTTPSNPSRGGSPRCQGSWSGSGSGAHPDVGDLVFEPGTSSNSCPLLFSNDGGVYYNTETSSPDCHTPAWEQPDETPSGLWLWAMDGTPDPGGGLGLYFGLQDDGTFATQNGNALAPNWDNQDCCDSFDMVANPQRVISTLCCFGSAPRTRARESDPGLQNSQGISSPPGGTQGFQTPASIAQFNSSGATDDFAYVTSQGVYTTTNISASSISWNRLGTSTSTPFNACAIQTSESGGTTSFFLQAGGCSYRSRDEIHRINGTGSSGSWTEITPPNDTGGFGVFDVDENDPDRIIASHLRFNQTPQMIMSTDGGQTWSTLQGLDDLMTGNGTFEYQTDMGPTSWYGFGGYPQPSLVAFNSQQNDMIVAGGVNSGVFLSMDSGSSWSRITDPLTPRQSGRPHIPRPKFAYFADTGSTLFYDEVTPIYIGSKGRGMWRASVKRGARNIVEFCNQNPAPNRCAPIDLGRGVIDISDIPCDEGEPCFAVDPVPENCKVKFGCPGCDGVGLCPPYYNMFFDNLDPETWRVDLYTGEGTPVPHEVFRTDTGIVMSFRPSEERFRPGAIGDYVIGFGLQEGVDPQESYRFGARLERSAQPYSATMDSGEDVVPAEEDCLTIDAGNVEIVDEGQSGFLVTDGRSAITIASDRASAKAMSKIVSRHTEHCFVGRDNQRENRDQYIMEYWKGRSEVEVDYPSEEDCISYDPESLRVVDEGDDGYLLTDGTSRMLLLDDQRDAERALQWAKRHSQHCFIGRDNQRPDRSQYILEYWKE